MKISLTTARKNLAQYHAYSNAAEMIRGHAEGGHTYADEYLQSFYLKQIQEVSKKLKKLADAAWLRYKNSGHEINSETIPL